jgi:hypothetical protein
MLLCCGAIRCGDCVTACCLTACCGLYLLDVLRGRSRSLLIAVSKAELCVSAALRCCVCTA